MSGKAARIVPGLVLAPLDKGRFTSTHIVRWCAAQENWAKIHFDLDYARGTAKLPGTLINGALKQHLLAQFLDEACGGWTWRIDYQFTGMDLVGQALEVRGTVREVQTHGGRDYAVIDLAIVNLDTGKTTTTGTGVVILDDRLVDAVDPELPQALRLDTGTGVPQGDVPEAVRAALGTDIDRAESQYPLDLSRLRLFAEAIMNVRPVHYDPVLAAATAHGTVVATPLFPLHGIDVAPGTYPLSPDPRASGREGVTELPHDLAARFNIAPIGSLNGGSRIEVHSLLRLGERTRAQSRLVGAKRRTGRAGGDMLIFETLNRFSTTTGRPLLTERHTSIYRLSNKPGEP